MCTVKDNGRPRQEHSGSKERASFVIRRFHSRGIIILEIVFSSGLCFVIAPSDDRVIVGQLWPIVVSRVTMKIELITAENMAGSDSKVSQVWNYQKAICCEEIRVLRPDVVIQFWFCVLTYSIKSVDGHILYIHILILNVSKCRM